MKKWNALSLDNKLIYKLADDLNVSIEISKLLIKRGITDFDSARDFFRPTLDNTHDPFLMKGMNQLLRCFKFYLYDENRFHVLLTGNICIPTGVSII